MGQDATTALTTWSLSRCRDTLSVLAYHITSRPHDISSHSMKVYSPLQFTAPSTVLCQASRHFGSDRPSSSHGDWLGLAASFSDGING